MLEEIVKICTRCGCEKSIDKFGKQPATKNGLSSWCKKCINEQAKEYSRTHKIEKAKYRKEHKVKISGYRQKYNQTHKTEIAEHKKKYRQKINGRLHSCFDGMMCRCNNSKCKTYKNYGGRGIEIKFTFYEFFIHVTVDLGYTIEKLKGLQIHRIDNDKHYEVGNIEFLTRAEHTTKHKEMKRRSL